MPFDLSNYETVDSRIHKFWELYKNGRLETELIAYSDKQYIVKASVWKDINDPFPSAVDYAEETIGTSPVNRTSALENCATSAIGRVLSDIGLSKVGSRPSVTEMTKSERTSGHVGGQPFPTGASEKQVSFVKTICEDAFINTGWKDKPEALTFVTEWLGNKRHISSFGELSKKEASQIINDKMGTSTGVTSLEKFLQTKQPADRDPWETPKD